MKASNYAITRTSRLRGIIGSASRHRPYHLVRGRSKRIERSEPAWQGNDYSAIIVIVTVGVLGKISPSGPPLSKALSTLKVTRILWLGTPLVTVSGVGSVSGLGAGRLTLTVHAASAAEFVVTAHKLLEMVAVV